MTASPRFRHGLLGGLLLGVIGIVLVVAALAADLGGPPGFLLALLLAPSTALALHFALRRHWPACWGTVTGALLVLAACSVWLMYALSHMRISM